MVLHKGAWVATLAMGSKNEEKKQVSLCSLKRGNQILPGSETLPWPCGALQELSRIGKVITAPKEAISDITLKMRNNAQDITVDIEE